MRRLVGLWGQCLSERWVHPLLALGAFNLDFLCIHPFRDGNGRVSRLLLLLQLYHLGYEAARYISLERVIEQNKDRYYETLEQSSQGWHESKHNPWPYINYLLYILKIAYKEFEEGLEGLPHARGEKTRLILRAIDNSLNAFSVGDILHQCPGISIDLARRVLKQRRAVGQLECLGRGQNAQWRKTTKWELGNTQSNGQ